MKFTINIDQKAIAENFPELDLKDATLIDFIKDFAPQMEKKIVDNEVYYWINYEYVIDELPLLKINTQDGVYRRLKKLCNCDILKQCPENNGRGKSYYGFGENYIQLKSDTNPRKQIKSDINPSKVGYKSEKTDKKSDTNPSSLYIKDDPYTNIDPNTIILAREKMKELYKSDKDVKRRVDQILEDEKIETAGQKGVKRDYPLFVMIPEVVQDLFLDTYEKKIKEHKVKQKLCELTYSELVQLFEFLPHYIKARPKPQYREAPLKFLSDETYKDDPNQYQKYQSNGKLEPVYTAPKYYTGEPEKPKPTNPIQSGMKDLAKKLSA